MHVFSYFFAVVLIGASAGTAVHAAESTPPPNTSFGGAFSLKNQVLAGGGKRTTGAAFDLTGTLAQSTAGPSPTAIGGNFALRGGFYSAGAPLSDAIFRNGFEN